MMDFLLRTNAQRVKLPSRQQVMHVYRRILKQARSFFDETTREFIQSYAKVTFRRNLYDRKVNRARAKLRNAQTTANRLERANKHRFKDVLNVLETGYGQKGPRKAMMLEAMVGIKKEEEVFGNLRDMAQYRPAFYALAMHQLGKSKVEVDKQNLKSLHPLNVAKTQDARWESLRYRVAPPVDEATMEVLEERARTGIIRNPVLQDCSVRDAALIRRWEEKWVLLPPRRQNPSQ
ncbi:hypothetical protein COEREDRAFT_98340 [Coemansia reversa NRRL 1564]|uniref:LYR motif-containing protein Cup1-like N-terminal domain-containing protein n=1 Tax=Coemansia reversa (strain ATCC 12441 / NRRL 1564) TaxID=763665 RepID=A0A2G5B843_COERN|nr:hypothetical protein COEREDRAFT_98340 [Coemansia reversa NRRL 1564]|eukprot:PIA15206.1 hypothetical protein COEREDRAFT_98340 [Coemansia reversa NRRL 1564]